MSTTQAAAAAVTTIPPTHITIDGSRGEGGGQILRNAVAYAAILGTKPVTVTKIRAGRSKPGLRPQHLTGIRLAAEICGGTLVGDEVGSGEARYEPPHPPPLPSGDNSSNNNADCDAAASDAATATTADPIVGDTGTAGSVTLLLQAALPCALFSPMGRTCSRRGTTKDSSTELELRGGTNAGMAPQIDYLTSVFLPVVAAGFGLPEDITVNVVRRGYYPRGGGIVKVAIPTLVGGPVERGRAMKPMRPITMTERGEVISVHVRAFHGGKCPRWVAQKMANAAVRTLKRSDDSSALLFPKKGVTPTVEVVAEPAALGSGSGVLITARTSTGCILAGSALGRPKVKPEKTGQNAAMELVDALRSGGCVDLWLQDQLILYMALAGGTSEIVTGCLTLHTRTAIMIAEEMTAAKFDVTRIGGSANDGGAGVEDEKGIAAKETEYGAAGLVEGLHRIRCRGIGFCTATTGST